MIFFKKPSNFFKKVNYINTNTTLKISLFVYKFQFLYILFNKMLATTNHTFLHFSKKLQYNFFSIFPIPDKQSKGFNFIQKKKTVI